MTRHLARSCDAESGTGKIPRAGAERGMKKESSKPERKPAPPLLVLISAPSGGGKTTLVHLLLAAQPQMTRAITCTTREPRPGEQDGVDYHFFSAEEFLKRLQAGNFIEHATVYGNSHGILKQELLGKLREGPDVKT